MSQIISVPDHILYEDEYILVVDKPAGLMVEPDRNGYPNLLHQVRAYVRATMPSGEEAYAQHIHRLDRPVSGVILFAKKRSVLKNLSEQFAERKVRKYYQCMTEKTPGIINGRLTHWLRKEKKKAIIYDQETEFSEKAILDYRVAGAGKERFLWDIELQTGKYHQIRAQLAHIRCPIVGDEMYGSVIPYRKDAIALQAYKLVFMHPVTEEELSIKSGAFGVV
ncbi:MAG: RluA family pseudouridine synthase [Bacteroidota bacterium]